MNTKKSQMEGAKVVILGIGVDQTLVDKLVDEINSAVGSDLARRCTGTPNNVLAMANKYGVEQVLFYGERELGNGTVTVRDMRPRTQYEIPKDSLARYIAACYKDK